MDKMYARRQGGSSVASRTIGVRVLPLRTRGKGEAQAAVDNWRQERGRDGHTHQGVATAAAQPDDGSKARRHGNDRAEAHEQIRAISAPAIREPGLPRLVISCELSAYGQVAFGEMRDWNSESPPHAACPSWLHTS